MSIENPKYDVAISFLAKDETIAAAIHQKLSESLEVFFFPRNQSELAGTDGLESMRRPFFDDSRVMVILYREPWGKTPWTRVEEIAIQEACLKYGWQRLFFIVLDSASAIPVWLPQNYVRYNYADFGLEQAVGAIKARVQDNGGESHPISPIKKAEIFKAQELFRRDKSRMNSSEGVEKVRESVVGLFMEIKRQSAEISARGLLQIRCGIDLNERGTTQTCGITDGRVGINVVWFQQYTSSLTDSSLIIGEYKGNLIVPKETGLVYLRQPQPLRESRYAPDLSLSREYGWKQNRGTEFIASSVLAEQCLIRLIDLSNHYANRE
jgi:hypothetical protein